MSDQVGFAYEPRTPLSQLSARFPQVIGETGRNSYLANIETGDANDPPCDSIGLVLAAYQALPANQALAVFSCCEVHPVLVRSD
ncbi:MAG: hypothetical protein SGJ20_10025 [Planctomycetota bacterium]|nr:hypothetical protein [Planctomycetota bacterium]